jgi:hypothetical protein
VIVGKMLIYNRGRKGTGGPNEDEDNLGDATKGVCVTSTFCIAEIFVIVDL